MPAAGPMRLAARAYAGELLLAGARCGGSTWSAALVVAGVAAIPAAFYIGGLGFYLDDHYFLGVMSTAHDRSVPGLLHALERNDSKAWLRPVMYLGLAVLFRLFGTNPLPYHLFVAALVPVSAVLLFLVLDRLGVTRYVALGVSIVFAAAPQYSTDRFWLASYAAPASVALALAAVYSLLRARHARGRRLAGWLVGSGTAIALSVLLYEVVTPLLIAAVILLWLSRRSDTSSRIAAASSSLVLAAALAYKVTAATTLVGSSPYSLGYQTSFAHHLGYLVSGSVKVNFGTYGLALPYVVGWILVHRLTWSALVASLLVGAGIFAYLARVAHGLELPTERASAVRSWRMLVTSGLVLVALGYASFLVTDEIYFTSAGIDNRVNIVAAIGVAFLATGLVLRGIQLLPSRQQVIAVGAGLALLAATGTFITGTLADYWVAASRRQSDVLARLTAALPAKLTNTTVVLDGVCPEIGPGIVFAAPYDLGEVLRIRYHDSTIVAPVATSVVTAERGGLVISTVLFGRIGPHFYPYRPRMLVYDWPRTSLVRLRDAAAARRYLTATPRPSCPPLRSFTWGIHTSRLMPFA
jgi:hypothetical protein